MFGETSPCHRFTPPYHVERKPRLRGLFCLAALRTLS